MAQKRISTKSQDSATATETQHTYHQKNVEEVQTADSFPQAIKSKITMLLIVIDQIDSDFKQARELILEIAKRLDEEGLCDRNEISRTLKKILREKIQKGKLIEKWIEECLPPEYKRTYVKSELSSLSMQKKPQLVGVSTGGKRTLLEDGNGVNQPTKVQPPNRMESDDTLKQKLANELEATKESEELKEVAPRQTTMHSTDHVSQSELELIVPKSGYGILRNAMEKSENLIYVSFSSRTFLRARP
ncbi:MAG: hypothetical protein WA364_14315, partial [Candidatus Nitrosopolaris sp.]